MGPRDAGDAARRHAQSRHAVGARTARRSGARAGRRRRPRPAPTATAMRRRACAASPRAIPPSTRGRRGRSTSRQRIKLCRSDAAGARRRSPRESQRAAGAHGLRRAPVARHADRAAGRSAARALPRARRARCSSAAQGQLNLSCAQLPRRQLRASGSAAASIPQAHPDRLSALPAGMAERSARCSGGCATA